MERTYKVNEGREGKMAENRGHVLVDRILILHEGRRGVGVKNVSSGERFFRDGGEMPGPVIIHALAQMTAMVAGLKPEASGQLVRVREVEIFRAVRPGDHLALYSEIAEVNGGTISARVKAEVEGETVAAGRLVLETGAR